MVVRWVFLLAYTCSGMAGLVYEVSWTRLLTLYVGHSTAAAAAVVAAFLGGLALGAAGGGVLASRRTRAEALRLYVGLELGVALAALAMPFALGALTPVLSWAYGSGGSPWFPAVRLGACFILVLLPAAALGATFPMAIRFLSVLLGRQILWTGVLISIVSFFFALKYFLQLARDLLKNEEQAVTAVTLLALYPFAVYFSAAYTEGLFLLTLMGAVYHFHRNELVRAAVVVARIEGQAADGELPRADSGDHEQIRGARVEAHLSAWPHGDVVLRVAVVPSAE